MTPPAAPKPPGVPTPDRALIVGLAGIAALWLLVLPLHLTPALFAALTIYGGTRSMAQRLVRWRPGLRHPQGWGLVLFIAVVGALGSVLVERAAEAAAAGNGYGALLQQMASALEQLRVSLPPWLAAHLPLSLEALREAAIGWLRSHASQVQLWGSHTVRGAGYALAGALIGALAALQLPARAPAAAPLAAALRRGLDALVHNFTTVVFAQLRIAAINTALTAVYLLGVLPLLGKPLPMAATLVAATFVASLVPVVGNLVSNTMIVIVSLTQSMLVAGLSLAWLVAIHKLEYFLNAQIIGSRIRAHAWELLLAMLTLEALFGLGGLISAPVIYAQLKHALHERGWV
ncbi:MAG: AI-2E family transporter [Burkholderiales bacterium]|nr:AI-2E family transporter [Burkholderiales bacterium]MDE2626380.1 AI-2E family transporter [Burkholderiales bacterium]